MDKKELRKMIKRELTISKARKQVQEFFRKHNSDECKIYVRCYSSQCDNDFSTDLQVEIDYKDCDGYRTFHTIVVASIEISVEKDNDWWELVENTRDVFKTMKKNVVKELEEYNYTVFDTEDYNI